MLRFFSFLTKVHWKKCVDHFKFLSFKFLSIKPKYHKEYYFLERNIADLPGNGLKTLHIPLVEKTLEGRYRKIIEIQSLILGLRRWLAALAED